MNPTSARVAVILALIAIGFWMMGYVQGDLIWLAYACWTLAAVYAILTSPRRFL